MASHHVTIELGPHAIDFDKLHGENRRRLIQRLRDKKADGVVFLQGGSNPERNDTDHEPLFRQESFFQWTFGVKEPDFFGAIDIATGKSVLFMPKLADAYKVWMGEIRQPAYFKDLYRVDEVKYVEEMQQTLKDHLKAKKLLILSGTNSDSGSNHAGATFKGIDSFSIDKTTLFPEIVECRVFKTEAEIDLMRFVCRISSDAHKECLRKVKPGMHEYQIEAIFRYYAHYNGGCRNVGYTCICGSGKQSSVLHYGHAGEPNLQLIKDGTLMLNDMGAEYHCYGADITRTFPVNGKFTADQRYIYETVLLAQTNVMKAIKPGVSWSDMHLLATRTIL